MTDYAIKPRLIALRTMLRGRLDRDGNPTPGYGENVAAIRAEIARLEGITKA